MCVCVCVNHLLLKGIDRAWLKFEAKDERGLLRGREYLRLQGPWSVLGIECRAVMVFIP